MTTFYDVPAGILTPALAEKLASVDQISMPEWGAYVKTGVHREKPPSQENWWQIRCAALMRKVAREGPIGVNSLAQAYGGRKDNGAHPNTPAVASRNVIRTALQQLEDAGLIELKSTKTVNSVNGDQKLFAGRTISAAGHKMLDDVAHSVRAEAEAAFPGLAKY
ncbi:MAG: 30S ribosomal protein S19e [Candidatus Poseidoniales archaeon]